MRRSIVLAGAFALAYACTAHDGVNLVRNPGFEKLDENGATEAWSERKPVYRFTEGSGRNDTRGLVYENSDPKHYSFPSQRLELKPGCCYEYEVWVRTEGLEGSESGATICLEWYADNKYLGGAYAEGINGTSDGWQRIHGQTQPIPTNATRFTAAPYVRRGMTGKAWFDDMRVALYIPPPVQAVSVSSYRHTAQAGPVTFSAVLQLDNSNVKAAEVSGEFIFEDAAGKVVRRAAPDAQLTPRRAHCTLDAATFPPGDYTVRFRLLARDGATLGEEMTHFHRVEQLPQRKVYIDEHRRMIVNGEPFFPLGMYWSGLGGKEKELEVYAQGPFNCLMPYGSPNPEQMNACMRHGLKVIYSIKDFYSGTTWAPKHMKTEEDETREIRKRVDLYRDHPAMIAWYINDEMQLSMVERLKQRQLLMEKLDPDHPTWVVLYQYNQIDAYLPTFDVVGTDPYPLPEKPVSLALQWTRSTRDLSYNTRAMWQVPQVFDWGAYRKGAERDKTRAPTLAEMRAMAWQCVAAGANGLVFYSYFDLYKMDWRDPFAQRWADVCAMGEELKRFIPVLLSVEPTPPVRCEAPSSVETRLWRKNGRVYLLAVNGAEESAKARWQIEGVFKSAHTEFGPAVQRGADGAFEATLPPLEPLMLRLE